MFMCIFFFVFGSFSYRSKVIVKGVSSIIGIGYSIAIITRESTVGALVEEKLGRG